MAIEKIEVEIAKEAADVMDLLISVVKDIKAGKSAMEISTGALPELMAAIAGADQIAGEVVASAAFARTIGMKCGELIDAFMQKKPAAPVA